MKSKTGDTRNGKVETTHSYLIDDSRERCYECHLGWVPTDGFDKTECNLQISKIQQNILNNGFRLMDVSSYLQAFQDRKGFSGAAVEQIKFLI